METETQNSIRLIVSMIFTLLFVCNFVCAVSNNSSQDKNVNIWERIMLIVLENYPFSQTFVEPSFHALASHGLLLTNYFGLFHPSQLNYIAMIAGSSFDFLGNELHEVNETNLVDLLEKKGISWKSYQEDYPGDCYIGPYYNKLYARKHNPFASFISITRNPDRCAKIVNAKELYEDVRTNNVPSFAFYTPNLQNNGHDSNLTFAGSWLFNFLTPLLHNPSFYSSSTLIIITFDEDDYTEENQVWTLLLSPILPQGYTNDSYFTHYSLLRTIEQNWDLPSLVRNEVESTSLLSLLR